MNEQFIKQVAQRVRKAIPGLKSSHAHAVIAHFYGYNSKVAMKHDSDSTIGSSPTPIPARNTMKKGVANMGETPLKAMRIEEMVNTLENAMRDTPKICSNCPNVCKQTYLVNDTNEYVCEKCELDRALYDYCKDCVDEIRQGSAFDPHNENIGLYTAGHIEDGDGLCSRHRELAEGLDSVDQEGYESNMERWNDGG